MTPYAKAAAVLHHTSCVPNPETAVSIFDALQAAETDDELSQVLEDFEAPIWEPLQHMAVADVWEQITMLAHSIDHCREKFDMRKRA